MDQFNHITSEARFDDQQFLHVVSLEQLKERELFDADAMVIEATDEKVIRAMLRQIRGMRFKNFYLKPIFVSDEGLSPELVQQTDGLLSFERIQACMQRSAAIGRRIREVRTINNRYSFKEAALVKTLQYLYTREVDLQPFRSREAKIGYVFPYLSSLIEDREVPILLDILKKAEEEGWLEGELIDRVNLCKDCYGGYLNFRESCPKCHSIDLVAVELIHHFRCAHIGPASDFERGDKLICPKCDKELRHIGIDYDKPSEIYHCNSCGHESQETTMKAKCVDCGTVNELQHLQTRAIKNYQVTAFGRDLAIGGFKKFDPQEVPLQQDQRILAYEVWHIFYQHELQRIQLRKLNSYLGALRLKEAPLAHLDQTTREKIMRESLLTISHYIRPVDSVTARDLNTFLLLLPEIKAKDIKVLHEILDYNIQKLLGDNLGIAGIIEYIEFFPVGAELNIEQL
ncbi:MAG: hypothetical protein AAFW73_08020 [Bacteroidota bacterium]